MTRATVCRCEAPVLVVLLACVALAQACHKGSDCGACPPGFVCYYGTCVPGGDGGDAQGDVPLDDLGAGDADADGEGEAEAEAGADLSAEAEAEAEAETDAEAAGDGDAPVDDLGAGDADGDADAAADGDADADTGPSCGNGVREAGEECDRTDFGDDSCASLGLGEGDLACTGACVRDTSGCTGPCTDECGTEGEPRCNATAIETCARGGDGCLRWTMETDCAESDQVCDASSGTPTCFGGTGDSCADPTVLGDLPYEASGDSINEDYGDEAFDGTGCHYADGADAVFVRWLEAGEAVRLRDRGSADLVFHVLRECSATAECLASHDDPDDPGLLFVAPEAGNYYLVVEAYFGMGGGYDFVVEHPPTGDVCADPIVFEGPSLRVSGDDLEDDFADDHAFRGPECTYADGADIVFRREMAAGETVRIREAGGVDAVLHVLASCDPAAACLGSRDGTEALGVSFTAREGGTYWFVAEARSSSGSREYEVIVAEAGEGDTCANAIPVVDLPFARSGDDFWADFGDEERFGGSECGWTDGAEAVFVREMAAGEEILVSDSGRLDLVLRIMTECSASATCLVRRDDPETPFVTFTAPSAGPHYFALETFSSDPSPRDYALEFAAP